MRVGKWVRGAVLFCIVGVIPMLVAAEDASSVDKDALGRAAFEAGHDAYDRGQFKKALTLYERARSLSKRAELWLDIGRAADADGDPARALVAYQAFAKARPDAPERPFVDGRIRKLRAADGTLQATSADDSEKALRSAGGVAAPDGTQRGAADSDLVRAAVLYRKACDGGAMDGCVNLGVAYATARGVPKDLRRASELYERACEGGQPAACSNLGSYYEHEVVVSKDYARAFSLYDKACRGKNALGCVNLAGLYESGHGAKQDLGLASSFYREAWDGGSLLEHRTA